MEKSKIDALMFAVIDIVRAPGAYRDKAQAIKEALDDDNRSILAEFLSWFDEEDE